MSAYHWLLHLHATEELVRDIRSMGLIKYSRLIPVYHAEMYALKVSDPVVWDAFSARKLEKLDRKCLWMNVCQRSRISPFKK